MDIKWITHVLILIIMLNEVSPKKRHEKENSRQRGKSRKKGDVTQMSLATLRKTKLANQRRVYVNDVIGYACLPGNMDRLVYRFQNQTHIFIAFDSLQTGRLTEMVWKLKPSNIDFLESRTVSTLNHNKTRQTRQQLRTDAILSASNLNQESRFKEDMDVCESQTGITSTYCLIQAFASLAQKMKNVVFDETCFQPRDLSITR